MPEQPRPLKVFLCHSHDDQTAVRALYKRLIKDGIDAWLDKENLDGGANWEYVIRKAVRESDIVVVCLSRQFSEGGFRQKEVQIALDEAALKPKEEVFIIPVRLEECNVPEQLGAWHYLDLFRRGGYKKLIRSLNKRIAELNDADAGQGKIGQPNISMVVSGNVFVGNDIAINTVEPIAQSAIEQSQDEKSLDFVKKQVPFETIKYISEQDFGNYQGTRIQLLYEFLEIANNPEFFFIDSKSEKYRIEFVQSVQKFCNSLRTLTENKNPNTNSRSIIYDPFDDTKNFETAKLTLHKQADDLVEKYNRLCKTAITVNARQQVKSKFPMNPAIIVAIIGLIGTLLAAFIGVLPQLIKPVPVLTATATPTITVTTEFTKMPSVTNTASPSSEAPKPSLTPIQTFTFTPTSLPTEITAPKGVTMRLVPAGEFTMGSDEYSDDEKPAHQVYLDDFYMDIYEVTNMRYKACVEAGVCDPPASTRSSTRASYYDNPEFDNYPVITVAWEQAKTYCEWRGARLPTEAEWEKAARGTDGRIFPWGDEGVERRFANYNGSDTSEVGVYPDGISPYGLYDMVGNVWEWVADWDEVYPGNMVSNSEFGTTYRVLRGGSWYNLGDNLRVSYRYRGNPDSSYVSIGFRCLRSP